VNNIDFFFVLIFVLFDVELVPHAHKVGGGNFVPLRPVLFFLTTPKSGDSFFATCCSWALP